MHILGDDQEPQPCVDCAKQDRIRLVRRLYGPNNEALCLWCHADRNDARTRAANATRHRAVASIDAWEPGKHI